ncbi:hypothetical protein HJG60_010557 [Phyllostomus discolor]|uniref:Uncharacterized protein n=1 Tax=Phyllostomus discolor TaxID=89673 RepID=A0A834EHK1_9CHIR|nr:hypothetical protein HJG60_010557 [Phyllostomus discolor]
MGVILKISYYTQSTNIYSVPTVCLVPGTSSRVTGISAVEPPTWHSVGRPYKTLHPFVPRACTSGHPCFTPPQHLSSWNSNLFIVISYLTVLNCPFARIQKKFNHPIVRNTFCITNQYIHT